MIEFEIDTGKRNLPKRKIHVEIYEEQNASWRRNAGGGDVAGHFEPNAYLINYGEDGQVEREVPEFIGTLRLLEDELGAGYLTHELFHGIISFADMCNMMDFTSNQEQEELFAWEIGSWAAQFWTKWNEKNGSE